MSLADQWARLCAELQCSGAVRAKGDEMLTRLTDDRLESSQARLAAAAPPPRRTRRLRAPDQNCAGASGAPVPVGRASPPGDHSACCGGRARGAACGVASCHLKETAVAGGIVACSSVVAGSASAGCWCTTAAAGVIASSLMVPTPTRRSETCATG